MDARARLSTTLDVAAIAFVARLVVIVYALAEPVWDGFYYDLGARRIAMGLGYSEDLVIAGPHGTEKVVWMPWAHYPVGYSGFLAAFYKLFGAGPMVAPIANALTGAALAAITHRVARHLFVRDGRGERRALVAGLLVALHPGLVLYAGAWMTEPLAAALMLLAVLLAHDRVPLRGAATAGVALGLATLVRPNAILLAPFLAVLGWSRASRALRARLAGFVARGAIVSACALATVAPWTLRNCRVMDACSFVSTNAGWNLVIGSAPGATGKFEFLVGNAPKGGPTCDVPGQVAQDRCWFRYGVAAIRGEPLRFLGLIPAKLHYTLDSEWFPINYLREARPDLVSARTHLVVGKTLTALHHLLVVVAALAALGFGRPSRARPVAYVTQVALLVGLLALATRCFDPSAPSVWPLGVAACILPLLPVPGAPRRTPAEIAVCGVVLTTLATHAIFFGEDRYHLVITPAFAILAAGLGRTRATG